VSFADELLGSLAQTNAEKQNRRNSATVQNFKAFVPRIGMPLLPFPSSWAFIRLYPKIYWGRKQMLFQRNTQSHLWSSTCKNSQHIQNRLLPNSKSVGKCYPRASCVKVIHGDTKNAEICAFPTPHHFES
jgi:hypothetical protein